MKEILRGTVSEPFTPALTAEQFNTIASGLTLRSVTLASCHCNLINRQVVVERAIELASRFNLSPRFQAFDMEKEGSVVAMTVDALMEVVLADETVLSLHCGIQVDYGSAAQFTQDFFDVFGRGPLFTHAAPFIREFFANTCARMVIPLVILPLFPASDLTPLLLPNPVVE